jgi:hypothetical protein
MIDAQTALARCQDLIALARSMGADAADAVARDLIGVTQNSFGRALEEYKARHAKPKPSRRRAKVT